MPASEIDWIVRWKQVVADRETLAAGHSDPHYWDRRAASFARSTRARVDEFLEVLAPFLSPRKTLIDVGAGAGRHVVPLASRLEWVTAVEPSEGMRSHIPPLDNLTVVASTWEDAEVAAADLVMCSHVMYGVADPVAFIEKMNRHARERVFVMLRESQLPHPAALIRRRIAGDAGPRLPRFSELFMLLMQMGLGPNVHFLRYPITTRYTNLDEAMADSRTLSGDAWDENVARAVLEETLKREDGELVFDGGMVLSGVADWQPPKS
jgi:Methyltransferase domain